jgi:hypothetical protein
MCVPVCKKLYKTRLITATLEKYIYIPAYIILLSKIIDECEEGMKKVHDLKKVHHIWKSLSRVDINGAPFKTT